MATKPAELTDPDYWEQEWLSRPLFVAPPSHYFFGRRGIFIRMLERHTPELRGKRILEIGGGNSNFAASLARWFDAQMTVLDYSPAGLERSREIFARIGKPLDVRLGDFFDPALSLESQDVLTHWGVLEHFTDPVPFMQRCAEVMRPDGTMVFSMPNLAAWGAWFWQRGAPANWARHVYHSDEKLRAAGASAGLELTAAFHWGPPLLRICRFERNGPLQWLATAGQVGCLAAGRALRLYTGGWKRISMHRGFVMKRR